MVIKSGRGVVYLTRPQKLFSSSYHPQKTNLSPPAPRSLQPSPPKGSANTAKYKKLMLMIPFYGSHHYLLCQACGII